MANRTISRLPWILLALQASAAHAEGWTLRATATSDYLYRGMSFSDGNPALQAGVDYEHARGLYAGAWASTVDLQNGAGRRDLEVDWYAGWRSPAERDWQLSLTRLRYSWPGARGAHAYDYNEWLLGMQWRGRWFAEYAHTDELLGFERRGRHWQLRHSWPAGDAWTVTATVGRNDFGDLGRFLHWDVGASARAGRITFDLRWYDNERADGQPANALVAGPTFVVSVTVSR